VIQLPPDLFFGTTIATCIIVLKKSKADNAVLFIDASAEFTRVGNKNKLTDAHQEAVLGRFAAREDVAHVAKLVPNGDIAANDYNIAVSSYVEAEDTREVIDITELNARSRVSSPGRRSCARPSMRSSPTSRGAMHDGG
jgi:type I restriction enzyme M protein